MSGINRSDKSRRNCVMMQAAQVPEDASDEQKKALGLDENGKMAPEFVLLTRSDIKKTEQAPVEPRVTQRPCQLNMPAISKREALVHRILSVLGIGNETGEQPAVSES